MIIKTRILWDSFGWVYPMMIYSCSTLKETEDNPSWLVISFSYDGGVTFKDHYIMVRINFHEEKIYYSAFKNMQ